MSLPRRPLALVETARALRELARTTVLFRLRGRKAVARATRQAMREPASGPAQPADHAADVRRSLRALQRAERIWPARVACLQHALVLHALLRRHDVQARVLVGSRLDGQELAAHAWLEVGDRTLDSHGDASEFHSFPAAGAECGAEHGEGAASDASERLGASARRSAVGGDANALEPPRRARLEE